MINSFEFQNIENDKLPLSWTEDDSIDELEKFIQESWNQRSTFYDDNNENGKQRFLRFDKDGLTTQNYIGTISFKGEQLNIFPKVFKKNKFNFNSDNLSTKELMSNLLIWIEYCDKSMFPFISNKSELYDGESFKELLITLYAKYVFETINRQLYFKYEDKTETLSSIKGKINFTDYICNKYSTGNKNIFECTYSNFEFDNKLNKIIKCVCRNLFYESESLSNKKIIKDILSKLESVSNVNCIPSDCDEIYLDSVHSKYSTILSMSKMFLLNKTNTNEFGVTDSFCFLFPAEMLFEGFVAGFIKEQFGDYMNIRSQANDQYLAELFIDNEYVKDYSQLREDILVEKDNTIFVLDTKYKELENFDIVSEDTSLLDVKSSDLEQMATYAVNRDAKRLCLIYPLYRNEDLETKNITLQINASKDGSKKIPCDIKRIPFVFGEDIDNTKKVLRKILSEVIEEC